MKVLMPTYGGGHVTVVIPLARELLRRGHEVLILPFSVAHLALERAGLPYLALSEILERVYSPEELAQILQIGEDLAQRYHDPESGIPREFSVASYGVSMYCLLQERGEAAWELFAQQGRKAFCAVDFMRRLIRLEKPDIVTASCYTRMEKAGIIAATSLQVHSLLIRNTLVHPVRYDAVDYQTAFNGFQKQACLDVGYAPDKVLATGQPAFDALFEMRMDVGEELRALGLDSGKPTILWGADGSPWVDSAYAEVRKAIAALPEYNFIVKLHPASNDESDFPLDAPNAVELKQYDIDRLLCCADLVVSQISTVLQQAMILDKKVLSLRVYGDCPEEKWRPFEQYYPPEVLRHVCEAGTLADHIRDSLSNPESEAPYEASRALYRPIRNGAKNICKYMESISRVPFEKA